MPALDPRQGYEARVWIDAQYEKQGNIAPDRAEWFAGPYFNEVAVVARQESPQFDARFSSYGPMLIQARLFWDSEVLPP